MKEPTFFKVLKHLMCVLGIIVLFIECTGNQKSTDTVEPEPQLFYVTVETSGVYRIVYDRTTKVMYNMSYYGTLTLLVNADGTPKIYDGDLRE